MATVHQTAQGKQYSQLWGLNGGNWSPDSRLPDFSFAGYHSGECAPPQPPVKADVRDFGALGDGLHDDTEAFIKAIKATAPGVLYVSPGRYVINDILWLQSPGLILRGAGPQQSILYFPKPLEEVRSDMSATTEGRPTSNYSWAGGYVWIKGDYGQSPLTEITSEVQRGGRVIEVADGSQLKVGDKVTVEVTDDAQRTLLNYLYSGDTGDASNVRRQLHFSMVSRINAIDGTRVTLERPLRFDIRKDWKPVLKTFRPTVTECGIENLGFEFPLTPYEGHFAEMGFNAIAINHASDCWIRNVRIKNSDSGIFIYGMFCSASDVLIESDRILNDGATGHHGITLETDCLLEDFDLRTHFIHDLSLDHFSSGNVMKNGRGIDLSLDHHRDGPYENLFSNIDLGRGTETWRCGGGRGLGKNCAARGTFWNFRADQNQQPPPADFGPDSLNFIGLQTDLLGTTEATGVWFEAIPPEQLHPQDLHKAQLDRRLLSKAESLGH